MREYFRISGRFLDGPKEVFEDYIVTNFNDLEEDGRFGEDDIFFFGLSEVDIISAIEKKEHFLDFVITSYEKA